MLHCDGHERIEDALFEHPDSILGRIWHRLNVPADSGFRSGHCDCHAVIVRNCERRALGQLAQARARLKIAYHVTAGLLGRRQSDSVFGHIRVAASVGSIVSLAHCVQTDPVPRRARLGVSVHHNDVHESVAQLCAHLDAVADANGLAAGHQLVVIVLKHAHLAHAQLGRHHELELALFAASRLLIRIVALAVVGARPLEIPDPIRQRRTVFK